MGVAKGVASRIDDAPVPKIVTFQKSFTTENEEKTIFLLQRSPAGICKSHWKSEEKREFICHSLFKILRNIDIHYRQACREVHGILETSMTLTRLWCPAVLVKTRVWMGSSVLQAHKTWSQSFLFKDFRICINKSFIRREFSDCPGRKYRGCFVRESSVSKKK